MSYSCLVEVIGWVTLVAFTARVVYNLVLFFYTIFLGRLLGHGIDLKKCGPWAGKLYCFLRVDSLLTITLIIILFNTFQSLLELPTGSVNPTPKR